MTTLVFAHRGASGYAPENTLEAFQLAVDMGAQGIELDVHLTRDGEIVVAHDERIDRVSDGIGRINDMMLRDLKKHKFNTVHPEYTDAKMPTLREVYELLLPTGLNINVELKNSVIAYAGLEGKCLNLAAEMGMEDRVFYSSFNHYSLLRVKKLNPGAVCGLLYGGCLINPWEYAANLKVDALHPHYSELSLVPDECDKAHALGLKVNTWTVNDERSMRMVIDAGADAMITNYPDRAKAVSVAYSAGRG